MKLTLHEAHPGEMGEPGARDRLEKAIRALREVSGVPDGEVRAISELEALTSKLYQKHAAELSKAIVGLVTP